MDSRFEMSSSYPTISHGFSCSNSSFSNLYNAGHAATFPLSHSAPNIRHNASTSYLMKNQASLPASPPHTPISNPRLYSTTPPTRLPITEPPQLAARCNAKLPFLMSESKAPNLYRQTFPTLYAGERAPASDIYFHDDDIPSPTPYCNNTFSSCIAPVNGPAGLAHSRFATPCPPTPGLLCTPFTPEIYPRTPPPRNNHNALTSIPAGNNSASSSEGEVDLWARGLPDEPAFQPQYSNIMAPVPAVSLHDLEALHAYMFWCVAYQFELLGRAKGMMEWLTTEEYLLGEIVMDPTDG